MMNHKTILNILHDLAMRMEISLDSQTLRSIDKLPKTYTDEIVNEFIRDLIDAAYNTKIIMLRKEIELDDFTMFMENFDSPIIIFVKKNNVLVPGIIKTSKNTRDIVLLQENGDSEYVKFDSVDFADVLKNEKGEIIFLSAVHYESIVGSDINPEESHFKLTPVTRLIRLLSTEKRDVYYVYIYAVIIGIISLILPLGIQAAVELISGGVFFSSIYFLIGIIILGVGAAGALQVLQITIVEYLQRRIFTKAAFEFAIRVPRVKMEAVHKLYLPELMNRFFDVLTIQKSLPKLLIDMSAGIFQILFGLLLLSFYHPFFVFFGLALIGILFFIFYTTGPKGLKSSIIESKYKYKAVHWLEEVARALNNFKLYGTTNLPLKKTDYFVNNYLKNRKVHFSVLITQYSYILIFKAVVTAGLLIIGTILVVQREITLGQFVASEVIIILILTSVEKIIMYLDSVYDMLTAVDKISQVTDLPIEPSGGMDIPIEELKDHKGFNIALKNLSYTFPGSSKTSLQNINLNIKSGEKVCISGSGASGKTTLINILAGLYTEYKGLLTFNDFSFRDLDKVHLRDRISKNLSKDDLFEGSILENLLLSTPHCTERELIDIMQKVGVADYVNQLQDGLQTAVTGGGKGFSESIAKKLILARCIAKKPNLLILNDFFHGLTRHETLKFMEIITSPEYPWTLIVVSNNPVVMSSCERIVYLDKGQITFDGSFEEAMKNPEIIENIM